MSEWINWVSVGEEADWQMCETNLRRLSWRTLCSCRRLQPHSGTPRPRLNTPNRSYGSAHWAWIGLARQDWWSLLFLVTSCIWREREICKRGVCTQMTFVANSKQIEERQFMRCVYVCFYIYIFAFCYCMLLAT